MIQGKRILLLMPNYYSLKNEIEAELLRQGAIVDYIETKIMKEEFLLHKSMLSLLYFIINPFYRIKYTKNIIASTHEKSYDYLFVCGIYGCTQELIKILKKRSNIKTIYYLWDANITWDFSKYIKEFDNTYTFDMVDHSSFKEYSIKYLPLFYTEHEEENINIDKTYDIVSIGTISPLYVDRLNIMNKISSKYSNLEILFWYYVGELNSAFFKKRPIKNRIKCLLMFLLNSNYRSFILLLRSDPKNVMHDTKLNEKKCREIEANSKSVLDISLENAGCSYRVISALSRQIKIITTNKNIINEAFYSPNNICVIDKENPVIDEKFLNSEFENIDMTHLRIDNWLNTIFESN